MRRRISRCPTPTNKPVKLSDFRGKKVVVVAFFPGRVHRWLNEGNYRVPVWYRKIQRNGCSGIGNQHRFRPTLAHWKKELNVSYPMLSDHMRKVSELYGVLIPEMGIANRTTFIVDTDGKIVDIQEGKAALDPTGAETACSRLKHK